ncbi:hypothetical protein PVAND_010333 [Polypedilum vanderplanki]|uniref:Uncharacterized protein n=1 Tax=Polypedilum vanderplanki TaxID=319348 RepID=A0A9J6CFK9_POLVA|nr:hypothetical protein PVAND_010333 [Polypedilum vanderplanki]
MYRTKYLGGLFAKRFKSITDNSVFSIKRNLFAANTLGLDTYEQSRERTRLQIPNIENFKTKMQEFVKDENSKNLIFTEDLKNMVHIADKEDTELLNQMIRRFCSQSKEVRFGNFIFGPPVMRYYYHIKDSETALQLFKDESLGGFFDQVISYQLLLDLLFETGKYQEVLDTYEIIQSRQLEGARHPKHVLILVFGACYKINTKESFEYAKKIWHNAVQAGHTPLRRAACFFSALALNHQQPFVALEVLSNLKGQNYVSVRAIKLLALAEMKRFDDIIPILRSILDMANPMARKQTIPENILEQLRKSFEINKSNTDLMADFEKVIGFIKTHGHVSNETLDQVLCNEIYLATKDDQQHNYQGSQVRRVRNLRQIELDRPSKTFRRPGLHELN